MSCLLIFVSFFIILANTLGIITSVFVGNIFCAKIFTNKAIFSASYKVVAVSFVKRLAHKSCVIRHKIL